MKLSPEAEKAFEEVRQSLHTIGHMSKAGVDFEGVETSLGTLNAAQTALVRLFRLKKALEAMP